MNKNIHIRPYSPADRTAVRHICCETGFSGDPVDPLFADREVFADFFTRYYTDWEPQSAFVVEDNGQVVGYLIGCVHYTYNKVVEKWLILQIGAKVVGRFLSGRYDAQSRSFLKWCIMRGGRETPSAPSRSAHFHFNLLPEYRNAGIGKKLFDHFVDYLRGVGVKRVFGQIQTSEDHRTEKVFQRFGFQVMDRREITKFRPFHDRKIYVSTVVWEIE